MHRPYIPPEQLPHTPSLLPPTPLSSKTTGVWNMKETCCLSICPIYLTGGLQVHGPSVAEKWLLKCEVTLMNLATPGPIILFHLASSAAARTTLWKFVLLKWSCAPIPADSEPTNEQALRVHLPAPHAAKAGHDGTSFVLLAAGAWCVPQGYVIGPACFPKYQIYLNNFLFEPINLKQLS